jgi:hypothetical protein
MFLGKVSGVKRRRVLRAELESKQGTCNMGRERERAGVSK